MMNTSTVSASVNPSASYAITFIVCFKNILSSHVHVYGSSQLYMLQFVLSQYVIIIAVFVEWFLVG